MSVPIKLWMIVVVVVAGSTHNVLASRATKPIAGQTFISLHGARNMAAHNRLPKVRANDRFIALKNKDDKVGIALPIRPPVEPSAKVAASDSSQTMASSAQAKQILSIFAPSD